LKFLSSIESTETSVSIEHISATWAVAFFTTLWMKPFFLCEIYSYHQIFSQPVLN
jgi:hypothetical protein